MPKTLTPLLFPVSRQQRDQFHSRKNSKPLFMGLHLWIITIRRLPEFPSNNTPVMLTQLDTIVGGNYAKLGEVFHGLGWFSPLAKTK